MQSQKEISVEFPDSIYIVPARNVQHWWKGEYVTVAEPAPIPGYTFLKEPGREQWIAVRNIERNFE